MSAVEIFLSVGLGFYFLFNIMSALYFFGGNLRDLHYNLNPIMLYRRYTVNWFGCFCLTILTNIIWAPFAICYWFYKLCTVGRR